MFRAFLVCHGFNGLVFYLSSPIPYTAKWLSLHVEEKALHNLSCYGRMWKRLSLRAGEVRTEPVEIELGYRRKTGERGSSSWSSSGASLIKNV